MIDNDFTYPPTLEELKQILIQRKLKAKQESIQEKSQVELAAQYARAELTHATQGPASEADAAARLAICMSCEHRAVEYKGQTDASGVGWCTKCGCGNNPRAMLTVKVTLAGVECPISKWGKVDGTGASVASAVDAVAGVAKSIIHKLSS
jgi:capsule polysaccharide export protein KpsC/LpsZ